MVRDRSKALLKDNTPPEVVREYIEKRWSSISKKRIKHLSNSLIKQEGFAEGIKAKYNLAFLLEELALDSSLINSKEEKKILFERKNQRRGKAICYS